VRGVTGRVLLLALAWSGVAQAQTMRPFGTFRQLHGETRLTARLDYAAGSLRVLPGSPTQLYRMDLSYDESRYVPLSDYDRQSGAALLGLKPVRPGGVRIVSRDNLRQFAAVSFSPRVDLALALALGAVEGDLDLGGLRITRLDLKTGASRTVVRFSQPNGARCVHAAVSAGAADVSLLGLGNSRCDEIEFEGGIGKVLLDFSGRWSGSSRVEVTMAVGELTLRLPRSIGVRLRMDRFLSSFEPVGLVHRGDQFESPNYDRTQRHLDLDLTTAMGGVNIEWTE
jgi:hypothetical protein